MNTCAHESHCWIGAVALGLAWLLVSSGLLYYSWNKVICFYAKLKPAKYWQALLLVTTVCSFCAPCFYLKARHHRGGCQSCHSEKKGECPYSHEDGDDDKKPATK